MNDIIQAAIDNNLMINTIKSKSISSSQTDDDDDDSTNNSNNQNQINSRSWKQVFLACGITEEYAIKCVFVYSFLNWMLFFFSKNVLKKY